MKKETRFLLSGILAGLVAGVAAAFTIDYWLAHVARTSASFPVIHSSRTPAESAGGSPVRLVNDPNRQRTSPIWQALPLNRQMPP